MSLHITSSHFTPRFGQNKPATPGQPDAQVVVYDPAVQAPASNGTDIRAACKLALITIASHYPAAIVKPNVSVVFLEPARVRQIDSGLRLKLGLSPDASDDEVFAALMQETFRQIREGRSAKVHLDGDSFTVKCLDRSGSS
jgi:hypothetical protein